MADKEIVLQKICNVVAIQENREKYAKYFDAVKNLILDKLCENPLFKHLYCGTELFENPHNAKFERPNEYNCHVLLNFAGFGPLKVSKSNISSAARVNVGDWLNQSQPNGFYKDLKNLTDPDGFINPQKIKSWFQGLIVGKGLPNLKSSNIEGESFRLSYSTTRFAQTFEITVVTLKKTISIELIPTIKLLCSEVWISHRKPVTFGGSNSYWNVVPQPFLSDIKAFKTSYTEMEASIINDKKRMKNVIKLVGRINEKQKLYMKNYHITTICMWMDEENGSAANDFWSKPICEVLVAVLERVIKVYEQDHLQCFWDRSENMIGNLKLTPQMRKRVIKILEPVNTLLKLRDNVAPIFFQEKTLQKYF